ncbi:MAG: glycosyltransferase [Flavobacteriales bacterium]
MGKTLRLFTVGYPYGVIEAFLVNELPILARRFDRVIVHPLHPKGELRAVPPGVEVEPLMDDPYAPASWALVLRHWRAVLRVVRCARSTAPSFGVFMRRRGEVVSKMRQALQRALVLKRVLGPSYDPDRTVLYAYWTSDWATALGLWKCMDDRVRFRSRMMGFDMYAHRAKDGWQLFQAFHLQQALAVHPISADGLAHVRSTCPAQANKLSLSYLASVDHGAGPWSPAAELRIASCSNLYELKRVHLIAEALCKVKVPVYWRHVGEGPELDRVRDILRQAPSHVRVDLVGAKPNADVIAWYKQNPVDVFLHLSRTEGGAPVALQEAASFGIPLLAADAGGVKEIVSDRTGVLLPNAIDTTQVAATIDGWGDSTWYTDAARAQVRGTWRERFDAEVVYNAFVDILLGA